MKEYSFEYCVKNHEMNVLNDSGINRHLEFRDPESFAYWFDIVTWKGNLCITGDMGCYVFSRLPDMFEFFRGMHPLNPPLGYLSGKVRAYSDQIKVFSKDKFVKSLQEYADCMELEDGERELLFHGVNDRAFDEKEAFELAGEWDGSDRESLTRWLSESDLRDYGTNFRWCCKAVIHAVNEYDKFKWEQ